MGGGGGGECMWVCYMKKTVPVLFKYELLLSFFENMSLLM